MAELHLESIERLQGAESYHTWKIAMIMKLIEHNLCCAVAGDEFDPEKDENKKNNDRAIAKICLNLKP
jgi:hypothetical protein